MQISQPFIHPTHCWIDWYCLYIIQTSFFQQFFFPPLPIYFAENHINCTFKKKRNFLLYLNKLFFINLCLLLLPPANEVWRKVMFLFASVILSTAGGGIGPGQRPPPYVKSGRYAFYRNTFLFILFVKECLHVTKFSHVTEIETDIILHWRIEFRCKWVHSLPIQPDKQTKINN